MVIFVFFSKESMRTLKYLFAAFVFVIILGAVVGLFLPSKIEIQRSIEINSSSEQVFETLNSMSNFNQWSPWKNNDPKTVYNYSDHVSGVGSKVIWSYPNSANKGFHEIIESTPYKKIKSKLSFGDSTKDTFATFELVPTKNGTIINWLFEMDSGFNLIKRYSGLAIEDLIAGDFEKGLAQLKHYVEAKNQVTDLNIKIVTLKKQAIYALQIQQPENLEDIANKIGEAFAQILKNFAENRISMSGTPVVITKMDQGQNYHLIAAIPVNQHIEAQSNKMQAQFLPAGKAIQLVHTGSYDKLAKSYEKLNAFAYKNKLKKRADSWEDYISDPTMVKESELITHIYLPVE